MGALFYGLGAWLAGSFLARLLVGAGLAVTFYAVLGTLADELIDMLQTQVAAFPAAPYNLLGLSGVWQGMGYVLSALMARVTILAASAAVTRAPT